ncbi:MAG: hypothetical protein IKZ08_02555 [Bacteroidales bacterium]|nr:hypothetical protein [Bacteroidales bacterium]
MSQAEELLNGMSADEMAAYIARADAEPHIVVNPDRTITVPVELRRIAVQFDHNIETVTFDCPRYWDEHDLSQMAIYINYKAPDNKLGSYLADDVTVDPDDENIMHFRWTISRNLTKASGAIAFLVCARSVNEEGNEQNHWNSELNQDMTVSPGMECDEQVVEEHPDVITQILLQIRSAVKSVNGAKPDASGNVEISASHVESVVGVNVVRDGSTITITRTLEGSGTSVTVVTLDASGYPSKIVTDGVECPTTWEGF